MDRRLCLDDGASTQLGRLARNRKSLSYANGVVAEYTYNAADQITDERFRWGDGTDAWRHQVTRRRSVP